MEGVVCRNSAEVGANRCAFPANQTVETALDQAGLAADQIDHVFLTGGSSLIPAVRRLFEKRFGERRIAQGNELTSIAHGLGLMAAGADLADWVIKDEDQA